jgi:GT2 family glycosyltransferase
MLNHQPNVGLDEGLQMSVQWLDQIGMRNFQYTKARVDASEPLVSIVIATWNRRLDVLETIRSVYGQDYPRFEIIVVDNASTDGTADELRASFPDVKLICLPENRGASGGRNAGMVQARGKYILCLDSDASPEQAPCEPSSDAFEDDPSVGAVNSKSSMPPREISTRLQAGHTVKNKNQRGRDVFQPQFF